MDITFLMLTYFQKIAEKNNTQRAIFFGYIYNKFTVDFCYVIYYNKYIINKK